MPAADSGELDKGYLYGLTVCASARGSDAAVADAKLGPIKGNCWVHPAHQYFLWFSKFWRVGRALLYFSEKSVFGP